MSTSTPIIPTHAKSQFADDPKVIAAAIAQGCTSVDSVDELPDGLKYLDKMLPGLLFRHHSPDGGLIPQFRPDNPKGGPKYIFEKGAGSVLSINPMMTLDRPTVAIVEGTKQAIFAAAYAPDDVLVVGIQGCWGWSFEGQGLASLDALVKGRDVIVIFDADVATNPDVYAAGQSLVETLEVIHASSIKFASIPGSKNVGLDDFLTRRPEADRGEVFAEILAKAALFTKIKKPAKRKVTVDTKNPSFVYVSDVLGEISSVEFERIEDDGTIVREQEGLPVAGEVDGRPVRRVDTLLYAAVSVKSLITTLDDLTEGVEPSYSYDLGLQVGPEGDCQVHLIHDVADTDLANPRRWLSRAGKAGLMTELGPNGQGIAGGIRIAEAIRADMKTRDFDEHIVRPHSGFIEYDGEVMWTDTGGAHTITRKRTDVTSKLEGSLGALDIPGYHENYQLRDVFHALDLLFDVENYLYDSTAWVAGLSALFWALAGGDPDAVLYIVGGEGSGKSSITGLVTSFLSKHWGTKLNPMASADGSAAYLRDLTKQPHNMLLVVDDIRGRSTGRSQDNQADGLENLIRPGYGGGGFGAPKKVRNAAGDWVQEKSKPNRFFLVIVGEVLPDAERQSSIERLLVVEVTTETSLKAKGLTPTGESGHEHFVRLSRESAFMPITSAYIMAVTQMITDTDGLVAWNKHLSEARTAITASVVATRVKNATPRVLDVAGTFISGVTMFIEWAIDTGYFDAGTYREKMGVDPNYARTPDEIVNQWHDLIIAATQRHSVVNLFSGGEAEIVINRVVDAVASGKYIIKKNDSTVVLPGQTLIGVETMVNIGGVRTECIALLPGIVGQIVGPANLPSRLDKLLVRDSEGHRTRKVRIDDVNPRCFVIQKTAWDSANTQHEIEQ